MTDVLIVRCHLCFLIVSIGFIILASLKLLLSSSKCSSPKFYSLVILTLIKELIFFFVDGVDSLSAFLITIGFLLVIFKLCWIDGLVIQFFARALLQWTA